MSGRSPVDRMLKRKKSTLKINPETLRGKSPELHRVDVGSLRITSSGRTSPSHMQTVEAAKLASPRVRRLKALAGGRGVGERGSAITGQTVHFFSNGATPQRISSPDISPRNRGDQMFFETQLSQKLSSTSRSPKKSPCRLDFKNDDQVSGLQEFSTDDSTWRVKPNPGGRREHHLDESEGCSQSFDRDDEDLNTDESILMKPIRPSQEQGIMLKTVNSRTLQSSRSQNPLRASRTKALAEANQMLKNAPKSDQPTHDDAESEEIPKQRSPSVNKGGTATQRKLLTTFHTQSHRDLMPKTITAAETKTKPSSSVFSLVSPRGKLGKTINLKIDVQNALVDMRREHSIVVLEDTSDSEEVGEELNEDRENWISHKREFTQNVNVINLDEEVILEPKSIREALYTKKKNWLQGREQEKQGSTGLELPIIKSDQNSVLRDDTDAPTGRTTNLYTRKPTHPKLDQLNHPLPASGRGGTFAKRTMTPSQSATRLRSVLPQSVHQNTNTPHNQNNAQVVTVLSPRQRSSRNNFLRQSQEPIPSSTMTTGNNERQRPLSRCDSETVYSPDPTMRQKWSKTSKVPKNSVVSGFERPKSVCKKSGKTLGRKRSEVLDGQKVQRVRGVLSQSVRLSAEAEVLGEVVEEKVVKKEVNRQTTFDRQDRAEENCFNDLYNMLKDI